LAQVWPGAQARPQPPQWAGSEAVWTHPPLQAWPLAQPQVQPGRTIWPGGQARQAGPLTVLQTELPAGQRQTPPVQAAPLQQGAASVHGWP
jgi:hypothetical protein